MEKRRKPIARYPIADEEAFKRLYGEGELKIYLQGTIKDFEESMRIVVREKLRMRKIRKAIRKALEVYKNEDMRIKWETYYDLRLEELLEQMREWLGE